MPIVDRSLKKNHIRHVFPADILLLLLLLLFLWRLARFFIFVKPGKETLRVQDFF